MCYLYNACVLGLGKGVTCHIWWKNLILAAHNMTTITFMNMLYSFYSTVFFRNRLKTTKHSKYLTFSFENILLNRESKKGLVLLRKPKCGKFTLLPILLLLLFFAKTQSVESPHYSLTYYLRKPKVLKVHTTALLFTKNQSVVSPHSWHYCLTYYNISLLVSYT